MSVSAITSAALQAAQNLTPSFQPGLSGGLPPSSKGIGSFDQTLHSQIEQQANIALHPTGVEAAGPTNYRGFALQSIQDTQQLQGTASHAVQGVMKGGGELHTAMIAMEEASVSFQMLVEMRNKIVESLQELMRMQI